MAVSQRTQYVRAAIVFAVLTVIGIAFTAFFYASNHHKRGEAAIVGTVVMAIIAVVCYVMSTRTHRGHAS